MFTLNLLGGAAFHGVSGPVEGRAAHRRRVALLAILAVARGRTVGRERIVGILWPEQTAARARHLLSESLYVLRKELGAGAFISAGDEVGLNGGVVTSDVEEFEAAVEVGDVERAARLYRGPFLDGFYVADAPGFEQWAEGERARLAHAHARAVECLATAREREGRPAEAAEWWRRLAVLDPYNSRVGMRLMLALDAAGERAAALWFSDAHAAFLRAELGVEPDDDFQELVERLRSEPVRVPRPPLHPSAPAGVAASAEEDVERGESDSRVDAAVVPASVIPAEAPAPRDTEAEADAVACEAPDREAWEGAVVPEGGGGRVAAGVEEWADPPGSPAATRRVDAGPEPGHRRAGATRAGRWWPRATRFAALAGVMAGIAIALLAASRPRGAPKARPAGYDPRRIAVLYFDDHSRGGELGYLADGLTEMLIHELGQVEALDVISRNGVKPYRERAVPFDSLVADLRVGSVVEGSVQRSGDEVRVTVQLVDAATDSHLESRTIVHRIGDVFALEDALADSVSVLLRRRLGKQVEVRRIRAETSSPVAWRWVLEAERARDEAARLLRGGEGPGASLQLAHADSLLAAAEREDPAWTRPTVLRGWVAYDLRRSSPRSAADAARAFAERALARDPVDPLALELHGRLLFARAVDGGDSGAAARAEGELRAALAADPELASAWATLSQLLRYRGRFTEAAAAARRALEEDAYLDGAPDILNRLFFGALLTGGLAEADTLCRHGHERFPGDWKFVECRLFLLRADTARSADATLATRLLAQLDAMDPPERARGDGRPYTPLFRQAVAAAVVARAGHADSARAMLARARRAAGGDPELRTSLAYDEAYVRLVLGEPDTARALLAWTLAHRPAVRPFAARDPLFRALRGPRQPF